MSGIARRHRGALDWLYERQSLGIAPGLARVEKLLSAVGQPHRAFDSVHVAGTNGKGSVAALLAEALRLSGRRVGLYTSPHLVEFGERVRVDGEQISHSATADLVDRLHDVTNTLDRAGDAPTFFELCTALALMHFEQRGVSWAVVEAGMGGALDATNVLRPKLAIITNVGLDHTSFLGDDLRSIATEKAGIVKPGVPVVTAARGDALAVIEQQAANRDAPLAVVGRDYVFEENGEGELSISHNGGERRTYRVGLPGTHQIENAAVVVASCDVLSRRAVEIDAAALQQALATTRLPGRLESIRRNGMTVIIDGAHNTDAAEAVAAYLSRRGEAFDLVVGFSRDKDWPAILGRLTPLAGRVWGVPIRSPRSLSPTEIGRFMPPRAQFETATSFERAWQRAVEEGSKSMLVAGSLFLAGEARAILTGMDLTEVGGSQ